MFEDKNRNREPGCNWRSKKGLRTEKNRLREK